MFLIGLLFMLLNASSDPAAGEESPPRFQEGQVLEATSGRPIALDELVGRLAAEEVIYVGEEHRNHAHIRAALDILEGLAARQRSPILALEMFSWDGQPGLDRYLSEPGMARADFLRESQWAENWGGAFEDYEPLVTFARDHRLIILALNPPRPLVRLVATQGMARALDDPEMARWEMQNEAFPEDPAYHEMIVKPLRQCHGGLTDQDYDRMYDASVFREEGMAKTIVARLRAADPPPGPIVSYTGGGHIQYRLPVPNRVVRRAGRPVRQTTIYLTAYDPARSEEIAEYLREGIADYIWLTAPGTQGMPRRCK